MFIAGTIGLEDFSPILFTGIRFLLLAICLSMFIRVPRHLVLPLFKIGLLLGLGMYLTLYTSLSLAENTSSVAIFSKLEVPFAIILGVFLLNEKIGFKRIAGITIAFTGAAVISFNPAAFDDLPALFWMAVSSGFGAYAMIKVRELENIHPLTITAWVSLVGAPTLILTSLLFESNHWQTISHASWIGWSALIYTAVMSSVIGHSALFYLLQRYPVSEVAPFSLLSPIFAVIGGVLFLDDTLTTGLIFGGCLILFGVGWIIMRSKEILAE